MNENIHFSNKNNKKKAIVELFKTRIDNYVPSITFFIRFSNTKIY